MKIDQTEAMRITKKTGKKAGHLIWRGIKKIPLFSIILAFVAGFGGAYLGVKYWPERTTSLDTNSAQQKIVSSQSELISTIAKDVNASVVSIKIESQQTATSLDMFFWGGDGGSTATQQSAGTGIILSSDGIIVTNKHVVNGTNVKISIVTSDGKVYDNVEILAKDPRSNYDIAFLKIKNVSNLTPAKLGDSSKMQVGDLVIAIGYALGEFENTVTSGIISGLGRPVTASDNGGSSGESLNDLFQTDAAINPGNSGGPLLNSSGEVIGINTAIASNAQNIGFSIPLNDIKAQIASILTKGKLEVPYLGVRYVVLTKAIKDHYSLSQSEGAWLKGNSSQLAVMTDSPADKAGLKEGDIITKVNNESITADNVLSTALSKYKVGDTLNITYYHGDSEKTTKATLELSPNNN
jgi:serine protease Do